ncbi:hypothetical protein TWF718_000671 [Orbilia javanica]|uniref:Uncharacterized protein n=2 Tax=Orbilia javanica TaxID=47235 RepID=A0AAN8P1I3_9PEZI
MSRDLEPSSSVALPAPSDSTTARAPGRDRSVSVSHRSPSQPTKPDPPSPASSRSRTRTRSTSSPTRRTARVVRIRIRRNSSVSSSTANSRSVSISRTASTTVTPRMATAPESVPDVATSEPLDPRRASTAPTEESASGVGLPDHRQSYGPQDEDEEMQDQYQDDVPPEEHQAPRSHDGQPKHVQAAALNLSPAAEYLMGIMAEFRKLEGKLASLLDEQARLKDENEELRNRPPVPDPTTLQDLENLTTKYNKVKKLYFQKESQVDQLAKENEALRGETEEVENLRNDNQELNRDLDILVKERDQIAQELAAATKEKEELSHQLGSFEQERDTLERERESLEQERDSVLQDRDSALQERDSVLQERNAILQERDAALQEREAVLQERDVILQEREDILRDRDAVEKEREEALQDKHDATVERDEARQDQENLQNRVKDLEDEVAKLQAQTAANANGVRDKRVSGPPAGHASTGPDYPQDILKLKYDKVKRLYYEQQKTISHLEERLRSAETMRAEPIASHPRGANGVKSKKATYAHQEHEEGDYGSEFF